MSNLISHEEIEVLAKEYNCDPRDICRACGQQIQVQIFKGTGHCSDVHRKVIHGDDPSAYPFNGNPATGAP